MTNQIGTVTIHRTRVYQLNPQNPMSSEIVVEPGTFPVVKVGEVRMFLLRGRINERIEQADEGLFIVHPGDRPSGPEIDYPRPFTPAEWAEMLNHPVSDPTSPEHRITIELDAG